MPYVRKCRADPCKRWFLRQQAWTKLFTANNNRGRYVARSLLWPACGLTRIATRRSRFNAVDVRCLAGRGSDYCSTANLLPGHCGRQQEEEKDDPRVTRDEGLVTYDGSRLVLSCDGRAAPHYLMADAVLPHESSPLLPRDLGGLLVSQPESTYLCQGCWREG